MKVKLYRRQATHYVMQSLASHCRGPGLTPASSCQICGGQSDQETRFYCLYCDHYRLHALQTSNVSDQREFQLIRPDMTVAYCSANSKTCFDLTDHYQVDQQHTYTFIWKLRTEPGQGL